MAVWLGAAISLCESRGVGPLMPWLRLDTGVRPDCPRLTNTSDRGSPSRRHRVAGGRGPDPVASLAARKVVIGLG